MSVHAHNDWADSMMEYGHANADELKAHRPMVQMQGRDAWPARRCSPEMQTVIVDRLREDYDAEDQSKSADLIGLKRIAVVVGVMAFCFVCYWVRTNV